MMPATNATSVSLFSVAPCFRMVNNVSAMSEPFDTVDIPYLLDQTPLSISRRSRIVAAPPDVLNEIVAALKY